MPLTIDEATQILQAGGSLILEGSYTADTLVHLAQIAAASGANLTVHGNYSVASMVRIAQTGEGRITFVVSK